MQEYVKSSLVTAPGNLVYIHISETLYIYEATSVFAVSLRNMYYMKSTLLYSSYWKAKSTHRPVSMYIRSTNVCSSLLLYRVHSSPRPAVLCSHTSLIPPYPSSRLSLGICGLGSHQPVALVCTCTVHTL